MNEKCPLHSKPMKIVESDGFLHGFCQCENGGRYKGKKVWKRAVTVAPAFSKSKLDTKEGKK